MNRNNVIENLNSGRKNINTLKNIKTVVLIVATLAIIFLSVNFFSSLLGLTASNVPEIQNALISAKTSLIVNYVVSLCVCIVLSVCLVCIVNGVINNSFALDDLLEEKLKETTDENK